MHVQCTNSFGMSSFRVFRLDSLYKQSSKMKMKMIMLVCNMFASSESKSFADTIMNEEIEFIAMVLKKTLNQCQAHFNFFNSFVFYRFQLLSSILSSF